MHSMSSFSLALITVVILAGAPPKPAKVAVPDPECGGGTAVKIAEEHNGTTRYCVRPNGQREGPFVKTFPSGEIAKRGSYHNGLLHGEWSNYDEKGTLREQGSYQDGKYHGYWTTFHKNGKKATTKEYGAGGARRGPWTTWSEAGQLVEEGEYRDNQKHGIWTTYDPKTGKPLKYVEWVNGKERAAR